MNIAIFDLDGTLADSWHRRGHLRKKPPDWDAFNDECHKDPPFPLTTIVRLLRDAGWTIKFVTTRPDRLRDKTVQWLYDNRLLDDDNWSRWGELSMYDNVDDPHHKYAKQWKVHTIERLVKDATDVLVFDDQPEIISAMRNRKIPVVPIFSGYYNWEVRA